jgi:hypothetical protein
VLRKVGGIGNPLLPFMLLVQLLQDASPA